MSNSEPDTKNDLKLSIKTLVVSIVIVVVFFLLSVSVVMAQTPTTVSGLLDGLDVPGIDSLDLDGVTTGTGWTAGTSTLYGESITVVVFDQTGFTDKVIAVLPANATLSSFLPVGSGTIMDDISLDNLAFVYVAAGESGTGIATSDFPSDVSSVLSNYGDNIDLAAGFNMFGSVDLSTSGALQSVLSPLGISNISLPLTQNFTSDLLSQDPKSMGSALAKQILDSMDISIPVSGVSLSGGGAGLSFSDTVLTFKGDTSNGNNVDVGVTGNVALTLGSTDLSMDMVVDFDHGASPDISISGSTTQAATVDLFHTFELDSLSFDASHTGSTWDWSVDATSTLHGSAVDVSANSGDELTISTSMTLAALINAPSTPGLSDITLDSIVVNDSTIEVDTTIKGLDVDIFVYRPNAGDSPNVGISAGSDFTFSTFISQAANTPLDDFSFDNIAFIWVPSTGAATGVASSSLPGNLGTTIAASKSSFDLTPGLNMFGSAVATASGTAASWLSAIDLPTTNSLLLDGSLSAQMFAAGESAETAILNALNINFALPAISISEGPAALSISNAYFAVRGDTTDGNKVVVDIAGDLGVTLDGTSVAMDLDMTYEHGASPDLTISGSTTAPITFSFFNSFDVANGQFSAARSNNAWTAGLSGTAQLNGQNVDVKVDINPDGDSASFTTTSTLAALVGESNLPGLDDVTFDSVSFTKDSVIVKGNIDSIYIEAYAFKRGPENKLHIGVTSPGLVELSHFVPQISDAGLGGVRFTDFSLLWVPTGSGETGVAIDTIPASFKPILSGGLVGATTFDLVPGVNLFTYLSVAPDSEYAKFLDDLGIGVVGENVRGVLPAAIFQANVTPTTETIKQAILTNLDIHWNVSIPEVPGLDSILTFSNAKLAITGKANAQNQTVIDAGISGDATLHVKDETFSFLVDIEGSSTSGGVGTASSSLTFTAQSNQSWQKPMGISWFDLDDIDLSISKDTTGNAASDYIVSLGSTVTIGGSTETVTTTFEWENGALTDAEFAIAGPLALSDIPGIKDLPNASEFSISALKVSADGIEADTTLNGNVLDFYAFEENDGWNLAVVQKNFKISELISQLDSTPAGDFTLSEAAVLISDKGLTGILSSFPLVAQDALKNIYPALTTEVDIAPGLSMIAAFGSGGTDIMSKGMSRMGASDGGILIGTIGGIFGGEPDVALTMDLDLGAKPAGTTSSTKFSDTEQLELTVSLTGGPASFVGQIGMGADITTTVSGDELIFDAQVQLQLSEEEVRVLFDMSLKTGNVTGSPLVWSEPYGIPGFELHSVTFDLGIDEDGAQHFGFAGDFTVAKDTVTFALDFDLAPEEAELPQDVAFEGTATFIEMDFLEAVAFQMLSADLQKQNVDFGMSSLPVPKIEGIKDPKTGVVGPVTLAFVTPGAQDPNLGLTSIGFGLKGSMHWLGLDLGDLSVTIGPESGIFAWGDLADINLGDDLLTLKDNNFAMRIPIPGMAPFNNPVELQSNAACKTQPGLLFCLNSSIDVIGISEKVRVDATSSGISFSASLSFGKYFNETIQFALTGIDLTTSDPSLTNADIAVSGSLTADVGDEIELLMKDGINSVFDGLGDALKAGKAAIAADKVKVDSLTTQINQQRAIMRAAKAKVEGAVTTAENRVNTIQGEINHLWTKYHHCHGWGEYFCKARYGIEIGGEKGVKDIADGVLEAAEALVSHVPIDLSPTVWPLIVARDTADGYLYVAEKSIEGLIDLDSWTTKGLDEIEKYVGGSINIKHITFNGDLKKIIASDAPVDLAIEAELFGTTFSDTFAFKIGTLAGDVANDFSQLGLMAYYGIDHLFMKALSDVPAPLKNQLRGAVGKIIDADQAANRRRLTANAVDFTKYAKVAVELKSTYSDFANSYAFTQMTTVVSPLDRLPASQSFSEDVIEIGNTGYCVAVEGYSGANKFNACAAKGEQNSESGRVDVVGLENQKLTTVAILENKKDTGYVSIQNTAGTQGTVCMSIPGGWANAEVTYGTGANSMSAYQSVFTPIGGKGAPSWTACATEDDQQNWKVLAHGEEYFQIINRATQDCVYMRHPSNSRTSPTSLAMISCVGADTQVFKLAPDVPATHHVVGNVLKKAFVPITDSTGANAQASRKCANGDTNTAGWGLCTDSSRIEWNYFEDYLGRRRFEAPVGSDSDYVNWGGNQEGADACLSFSVSGTSNRESAYPELFACDSTDEAQWLVYTQVVGGFTLASILGDQQGYSVSFGTRYPDPLLIRMMPDSYDAGVQWQEAIGNVNSELIKATEYANAAYPTKDQTNTAIGTRVSDWAKLKSELDSNKTILNEGKEHCISSSSSSTSSTSISSSTSKIPSSLCYMTGPNSPYVVKSSATTTTATAAVPATATVASTPGTTTDHLTNGTMVVSDDMSASSASKVAAYRGTPAPSAKWAICRVSIGGDANQIPYDVPGVVENLSCVQEIENKISTKGNFTFLHNQTDTYWQAAGSGYLPSMSVPTGRAAITIADGMLTTNLSSVTTPAQALFSCRSMINRVTYIGWTFEGEFCHIKYSGNAAVTRNFQVLAINGDLAGPKPPAPRPAPSNNNSNNPFFF